MSGATLNALGREAAFQAEKAPSGRLFCAEDELDARRQADVKREAPEAVHRM